jgi:hypothetical protein
MAIEGVSVLEIRDMLHHQDLSTTLRYINQKAVSEIRRQKRNQLKWPGEPCDTVAPSNVPGEGGAGACPSVLQSRYTSLESKVGVPKNPWEISVLVAQLDRAAVS